MILSTITGNLGADAEIKTAHGGTQYLKLKVAVNSRRKNKDGQWGDFCQWVTVFYFRGIGLHPYLTKGAKVIASGEMQAEAYIGRQEVARVSRQLKADHLILVSTTRQTTQPDTQTANEREVADQVYGGDPNPKSTDGDDLPF